jgi:single-strand DNA-binding protein
MNKVTLIGRLTKDPELKFTPGTGTAVATFTVAVDRRLPNKDGQREADFIPIVVWGKQAENTANYMSKGKLIAIAGRIQTRSYDAKDGTKRYVTEVVAEEVQFLDKGTGTKGSDNYGGNSESNNKSSNTVDYGEDMTPVDDGDIPF